MKLKPLSKNIKKQTKVDQKNKKYEWEESKNNMNKKQYGQFKKTNHKQDDKKNKNEHSWTGYKPFDNVIEAVKHILRAIVALARTALDTIKPIMRIFKREKKTKELIIGKSKTIIKERTNLNESIDDLLDEAIKQKEEDDTIPVIIRMEKARVNYIAESNEVLITIPEFKEDCMPKITAAIADMNKSSFRVKVVKHDNDMGLIGTFETEDEEIKFGPNHTMRLIDNQSININPQIKMTKILRIKKIKIRRMDDVDIFTSNSQNESYLINTKVVFVLSDNKYGNTLAIGVYLPNAETDMIKSGSIAKVDKGIFSLSSSIKMGQVELCFFMSCHKHETIIKIKHE